VRTALPLHLHRLGRPRLSVAEGVSVGHLRLCPAFSLATDVRSREAVDEASEEVVPDEGGCNADADNEQTTDRVVS
jgi:hypothetical protein